MVTLFLAGRIDFDEPSELFSAKEVMSEGHTY